MIGHTIANLWANFLEDTLNGWLEANHKQVLEQVGFHLVTLQAIIEENRAHNQNIYCYFVDFQKAFDTVLQKPYVPCEL